jgi:hypothetical protein
MWGLFHRIYIGFFWLHIVVMWQSLLSVFAFFFILLKINLLSASPFGFSIRVFRESSYSTLIMFMNCSWTYSQKVQEFENIQIFTTKVWTRLGRIICWTNQPNVFQGGGSESGTKVIDQIRSFRWWIPRLSDPGSVEHRFVSCLFPADCHSPT